ncbi:hypothetical protein LWI29_000686 [Acer saccharum]|uniref:Uncharacterized protein n=1 Tax=Acer saccharum TaxID=4024 RepID=A0AA39T9W9_ACESA|nr:hypothetical protein LWI29_000686 [Acer saccharum]
MNMLTSLLLLRRSTLVDIATVPVVHRRILVLVSVPGLAVVIVGNSKDSQSYVNMKRKAYAEVRIKSFDIDLLEQVSEAHLISKVHELNAMTDVHVLCGFGLPNFQSKCCPIVSRMLLRVNKRARAGEGSSVGESQELAPCVRNRDYGTRKAILMNCPIIHERGIQVSTLESTTIPAIVEARKWENFVMSRGLANITLVREFFTSMVPETFRSRGCVLVRNVVVEILENKINEHFGTTPVRQSALPLGYASFDGDFEKLAELLRGNEDGVWTKKHPIRQSDLSKDMALMNLFNSASLRPVSHTSSISVKRAELIACYLTGGPIDVGRVIKAELNDVGEIDLKNKPQAIKKPIPFSYLITTLCRETGVPELDNDERAKGDKGDLNLRSWNDTTSKTKGRRKLWRLPSSRSRADSGPDESDEEDEDFEP